MNGITFTGFQACTIMAIVNFSCTAAPVPTAKPVFKLTLEKDPSDAGVFIAKVTNKSENSIAMKWTLDPVQLITIHAADNYGKDIKTVSPVSKRSPLDPEAVFSTAFDAGKPVKIRFVLADCFTDQLQPEKLKLVVKIKYQDSSYESNTVTVP